MEYKKNIIKVIIGLLWIGLCVFIIVKNYQPIGLLQLLFQVLALAGILIALYIYNRKYK